VDLKVHQVQVDDHKVDDHEEHQELMFPQSVDVVVTCVHQRPCQNRVQCYQKVVLLWVHSAWL
jgi:hypothetical protein